MLDNELLTKIAEEAVRAEEELSHFEETGSNVVHFDFDIKRMEKPILYAGRSGDYYKFSFTYEVKVLDESNLTKEDEIRTFRRSLRLAPDGKVVAIGERVEVKK
jgi:hypothetical protein